MPEFRNPNLQTQGSGGNNAGGGGDTRFMLAFTFLAVIAILGYQYFFQKPQPANPPQQQQTQQATQQQAGGPTSATTAGATAAAAPAQPETPAVTAAAETETTIENDVYKIVFTNRGAQVKQWILKKYKDYNGKPLDMVQTAAAEKFGAPLSFFTYEPQLTSQVNQALYQASATGNLSVPGSLTFHYSASGLDVLKTIRFDSTYVVTVEAEIKRNGAPVRSLVAWPSSLGDQVDGLHFATGKIVTSIDAKDDSIDAPKVGGNATMEQPFDYAGVTDTYFAATFLPDAPQRATAVTLHNSLDVPANIDSPNGQRKPVSVIGIAMGDTGGYNRLRLFVGPKDTSVLKTIHAMGQDGKESGPTLHPLIQYGWFGVIARPLYLALRFLHDRLGSGEYSWGWAIILFTTLFNIVMLPLRFRALRSSWKMMRVQPQVEALKRRFAHLKFNDPKRAEMNTEMMALYKREGVSMYGSCLPMLPQLPLFFAYVRVLQGAVELRQAHWFWLKDLSLADPLHILPVGIIITMFLMQYITPMPGMDNTQRRMMAFMMPVMMCFFLWSYASGMGLYWITNNVSGLLLQLYVNQTKMGKDMHAVAAKKAQKTIEKRR